MVDYASPLTGKSGTGRFAYALHENFFPGGPAPEKEDRTLFAYWRARLTDVFISAIRQQGGILVNLASAEMKNLFDWTRVTREVRVITPDFYTYKGGRLSTVVVYAKMCRGEMTRFILKNRIENPEDLKTFEWEGYRFNPRESHDDHWVFTPGT